jgi:hypothetical protein
MRWKNSKGRRHKEGFILFLWALPLSMFPFLLLVGLAWLNTDFVTDKGIIFQLKGFFIAVLYGFHLLAWVLRRWMTVTLVRAIDYLYLSAAGVGFAIAVLRQNVAHSQYAELWSQSLTLSLAAALALRMTRTTIEVFGWHQK